MLSIAICEDDKEQQQYLEKQIEDFNILESMEILKYDSGTELIRAYEKALRFSIILLDMRMSGLDGIQTAEIVRKYDKNCLIIIITSTMEYAVDGYSINAYDFILKPVNKEKLEKVLRKAVNEIQSSMNKTYVINTRDKTTVLRLSELIYIESDKKRVIVYGLDKIYTNNENISSAEKRLSDQGFIRISRYYLVNLSHIKEIGVRNITLSTGDELCYSKKYREEIKKKYIEFVMGDM
jgi:DNA-binding LytR/AlgR family response regulator